MPVRSPPRVSPYPSFWVELWVISGIVWPADGWWIFSCYTSGSINGRYSTSPTALLWLVLGCWWLKFCSAKQQRKIIPPLEPPRPEVRRFLDYAQRYSAHVSV